jgi:hypothetical protein
MVAQFTWRTYDIYLQITAKEQLFLGHTYRRSLVRVYDIQIGDVLSFEYLKENNIFEVTVYHFVDSDKEEKNLLQIQV